MKRKVILFIILIVPILFISCMLVVTVPEYSETDSVIAYDNGKMQGAYALGFPGYLVHFSLIDEIVEIDSIFIFCCTYGNYNKRPKVFILDTHYQVIQTVEFNPAIFSKTGNVKGFQDSYPDELHWVEIPVGNIVVEKGFYILFFTYSDSNNGIMIGYTGNRNNNHTAIANVNRILPWTLTMNVNSTNWIIRTKYSLVDAPLSQPFPPQFTLYEEAIEVLNTPEKLSQWMVENIAFNNVYGSEYTLLGPEDVFVKRSGICADLSAFAFDVLQKNGFNPLIMAIQISMNDPNNHAICVFEAHGEYFIINNGILQGPFNSYEEIAENHHKKWWRYQLFDTIEDTFSFQNPIVEVYQ